MTGQSIDELNRLYDERRLSPVEVAAEAIRRLEARPELNAFCHVAEGTFMEAARRSEQRMMRGTRLGKLDGVPFDVKDNLHVAGMPATWGSKLYEGHVPAASDAMVDALFEQGALCIGKTNTPEFALSANTANLVFGQTRNAIDEDLSPGGSSGGSASAVAAAISRFSVCTDAGGSTRRPACYTQTFGLKTTGGAVVRGSRFPTTAHDFQSVGLIAAGMEDLETSFQAIASGAGQTPRRETGSLAVVLEGPSVVVEPAIAQTVFEFSRILARQYRIFYIAPFWDHQEIEELWKIFTSTSVARIKQEFASELWAERATPPIRSLADEGERLAADVVSGATERLDVIRRQASSIFETYDAVITPASSCYPWKRDLPYQTKINGRDVDASAGAFFSRFVNAMGLCATSLPVPGLEPSSATSIQIVLPPFMDRKLLELSKHMHRLIN